jgi:N-acetylglucosamine-6-phosphate deacetylase
LSNSNSLLLAGRLAREGTVESGWVEVEGERIAATGRGPPPRPPDIEHDGIVAPGFWDLQVNGAAGHEVSGGSAALDAIDSVELEHGVTSYLPTIVSGDEATVERSVAELAERAADRRSPVAGVHLEGPFLSPSHAGVHSRRFLRAPADGVPAYFSSPAIRLVTLAPELPGALELIAALRARGVVVSLGHTGADAGLARRAIDAGARLVTHVFNAMSPLHHRAPGLAGVALVDPRVHVGVIPDAFHIDPLVLELVWRAAGERVVLVSDATPAAAAPPGRYSMGGVTIESSDTGAVRTTAGQLAGSALTLDAAVRGWASTTEASLEQAIAAASEAPAAALGLAGGVRAGAPADVVLLDDGGRVQRVMRRGSWISPS